MVWGIGGGFVPNNSINKASKKKAVKFVKEIQRGK